MKKVLLKDLAYGRSGDKGDICNVGIMAFNRKNYEIIRKEVTPERIKKLFKDTVKGQVKIYEMPNIDSLQIVMYNALGGGATRSLRYDQTGKSMCTAVLRLEIAVE